ncbi:acyl carrier protein [Pseudomonas frederiksbergensis]|uniref:Acyl carrier protein n=1 Tax=Pseudomonas frederiksbergensis TaxID=104087 RepID=A0A423JZH5_9PSED|nr:acyl carrier protein [Pseudomonas frederiksbergensis]RON43382.1 acyl carrier protein [Pseudomonas frederiksbergensis]
MSDTLERVKTIVSGHLDVSKDQVVPSAAFVNDLGADSLHVVELVLAFQEEFNINIPDDEIEEMKTVGNAVTYIDANRR